MENDDRIDEVTRLLERRLWEIDREVEETLYMLMMGGPDDE